MEDAAEAEAGRPMADADEAMLVWTGAHKDGVSDLHRRRWRGRGRGGMDDGPDGRSYGVDEGIRTGAVRWVRELGECCGWGGGRTYDRRRGPLAGGRGDGVGRDRGTRGERLRRDGGWVVDHKSEW
jgi:hypothetical protein